MDKFEILSTFVKINIMKRNHIDKIISDTEKSNDNTKNKVEATLEPSKINRWDKSVKVEENGYYWNNDPILVKGSKITNSKPIIIELF